jgi:hypothetical protein
MKNKAGITLLFIGGICMIISATIGSIGIYEFLWEYVSEEIPEEFVPIGKVAIIVLRVIADTGGFAVIIGTIFLLVNHYRLGKFLIGLGLTFGSIALIIWIISEVAHQTDIVTDPEIMAYLDRLEGFFTYNTGLSFAGVTIAIIGRMFIKKPKEPKEPKEPKKPKKVKQEVKLEEKEDIFEENEET